MIELYHKRVKIEWGQGVIQKMASSRNQYEMAPFLYATLLKIKQRVLFCLLRSKEIEQLRLC